MSTKIDRVDHQGIYDMYMEVRSITDVCNEFMVSDHIVKKVLEKFNIKPTSYKKVENLDHNSVIKTYKEIRDIEIVADQYNVSVTTIDKILKLHNIVRMKKVFPSDEDIIRIYHEIKKRHKTSSILGCSLHHIDKILTKYNIKRYGSVDIGDKFGRFTVIGIENPRYVSSGVSQKMLKCECECGSIRIYSSVALRSGKKTSCGCIMKERMLKSKRSLKLLNQKSPEELRKQKEERQKRHEQKLKDIQVRKKKLEEKLELSRRHIGDKVRRWTILTNESNPSSSIKWSDMITAQCECGTVKTMKSTNLNTSTSCGCYQKEQTFKAHNKHNIKDKEHKLMYCRWKSMKARCYHMNNPQWINYGLRGISICDRWLESDGQGFINFCKDMGPRPNENYSIDRIDNDGNYEPSNCQWATKSQQARNQRRGNRKKKSPPNPF